MMLTKITISDNEYTVDLSRGHNISIPLSSVGPRAWYVDPLRISPVINRQFTGSVKLGGAVNFNDIHFNPHGHGTHTESVGHISRELISVNQVLEKYFFISQLITITPIVVAEDSGWIKKGDRIITSSLIKSQLGEMRPEALVIRTFPNLAEKLHQNYSSSNFPYFSEDALAFLAEINVEHLLVDLPSVDREEDGGLLKAHHAFWKYPGESRKHCTISEFVFVKDEIVDGTYLLNLQVAPFENDASPSRPVLYSLLK